MKAQITVTDVHISLRWLPSLFLFFIKNGESEKSKQNLKKKNPNPAASVSAEFKLADSSLHWEAEKDAIIKISWTRQKSILFGRTVMKVYREKLNMVILVYPWPWI